MESPSPIFIVGLPSDVRYDAIHLIAKQIEDKVPDYHTLVYKSNLNEFSFQAFYPKDFDEVAFEELKSQVLNLVNL